MCELSRLAISLATTKAKPGRGIKRCRQRFAAVPLNLAPNVRLLSLFGVGDERWISSTDGLFRYLR